MNPRCISAQLISNLLESDYFTGFLVVISGRFVPGAKPHEHCIFEVLLQKTLIFQWVRIKVEKAKFSAFLLELVLELVRTKLELIAYATQSVTEINPRCTAMRNEPINWDEVPDVMTKEQLWRVCHISKSTARFLLISGKIPCMNTGGKTRCYKILKKDVMAYIEDRKEFPEYYMAAKDWYSKNSKPSSLSSSIPEIRDDLHEYYAYLLRAYPDVLNNEEISKISGYSKTAINNWCKRGHLRHFLIKSKNMIPKVYLIDFFVHPTFAPSHGKARGM